MQIKGVKHLPWNKKIQILRIANNLTQKEAAVKCCTNQKGFWQWEKGKSHPNEKNQKLIATVFNVTVEYIFKS